MNCPLGHETRHEHDGVFCTVCLKHYPRCRVTLYMEPCNRLRGHDGDHKGPARPDRPGHQGSTWNDNSPGCTGTR